MDQQQKPTITGIRIRNTSDAHVLFYAVSLNILPMIKRRLDPDERAQVRAGNCYIWEERSTDEEAVGMGMERWTDGLQWGPSRTRDEFLFYIQKSDDAGPSKMKYGRRPRSQRAPRPSPKQSSDEATSPVLTRPPTLSSSGTSEEHKLVKQTYSVHTRLPSDSESRPTRKWHLTAYYTPYAVSSGQLKDINQFPELMQLQVPPGRFRPARVGKRGGTISTGGSGVLPPFDAEAMASTAPTLEPSRYPYAPSSAGSSPMMPRPPYPSAASGSSWPGHPTPPPGQYSYSSPVYPYTHQQAGPSNVPAVYIPQQHDYSPKPVYPPLPSTTSLRPRNLSLPTNAASRPDDQCPSSPLDSPMGSEDGMDVASTAGGGGSTSGSRGLQTLSEDRALPPLDFTNVRVPFPARTAEDERTLWALNTQFNR